MGINCRRVQLWEPKPAAVDWGFHFHSASSWDAVGMQLKFSSNRSSVGFKAGSVLGQLLLQP